MTKIKLKITYLKFHSIPSGSHELMHMIHTTCMIWLYKYFIQAHLCAYHCWQCGRITDVYWDRIWTVCIILGTYFRGDHDDVIKWKHFPRCWPFVRGIHRSPVNSPHIGQWCGALMFSLICARTSSWVNNRDAGDLIRHRAHYVVIVMNTSQKCTHFKVWSTKLKLSIKHNYTPNNIIVI